jgi:dolichol-phosphate mannosyltransferase
MKILVAIPVYNEKDNIGRMINSVLSLNGSESAKKPNHSISLLIIDDNSPDGTRRIVKEFMDGQKDEAGVSGASGGGGSESGRLFLIEREKKMGLGTAYTAAFNFAVEKGYDYVLTMDCDFSHNPEEIAGFVSLMETEKCGMITGSRYSGGIRIINWSMKRLLISYFANIYAKLVTGVKISDLTGGFNMYDVNCLKKINLGGISSRGYAFQIEMKYRMVKEAGCSFKEYPIIFYERTMGKSKMSKGIIFEAFFRVIKLRLGLYR